MEKIRVLVAEDEDPLRNLFTRTFTRAVDMDISTARNGTEAIEMMDKNDYDAVISDLQMPGRNGAEVLTHAAKIGVKLLILMSGRVGNVDDANALFAELNLPGTLPERVIIILKEGTAIIRSVNVVRTELAKILLQESR